ncbi:hypothetical protein TNCV_4959851 [Trichonephila clavipes]|uniref:Uncharacterized protein n=1 Tax=Trichonephila clavipes TaxID=2585209 RepID=A0A8X6SL98_TRICX|nr:hypothetical protein TNCV_4959851 [Trichonephila clavipes]
MNHAPTTTRMNQKDHQLSGQQPVKAVQGDQKLKHQLTRKERKDKLGMTRRWVENREGSLGYPRFVKPVFTKDSKPLGKRKRSLG